MYTICLYVRMYMYVRTGRTVYGRALMMLMVPHCLVLCLLLLVRPLPVRLEDSSLPSRDKTSPASVPTPTPLSQSDHQSSAPTGQSNDQPTSTSTPPVVPPSTPPQAQAPDQSTQTLSPSQDGMAPPTSTGEPEGECPADNLEVCLPKRTYEHMQFVIALTSCILNC